MACGSTSNRLQPDSSECKPGNNTEQNVSQSTRFRMWEKSLLDSLRQMRLDEEKRLVDRRESLHIEIPASPRSPIGRRLSELQTPPFPSRSNGEDRGLQDGHGGTPYARCGAYQLVYANSALQDLHHQLDDSRRFLNSMIKLKVKSSGLEEKKKQATSTSETIVRMLNRLENACGRILREQDLLANEMESRAPEEKWKNMLDTVMTMANVLQVEGKVEEEV
ncbi:Zinc finger protein C25B8.19c [Verticillium dahliae VDG1]|nr:Zinc finger protein C25B8.19c [Verticillium dahliae VDG1]